MFKSNSVESSDLPVILDVRLTIALPRILALLTAASFGMFGCRTAIADAGPSTAPPSVTSAEGRAANTSVREFGTSKSREAARIALKPSLDTNKLSASAPTPPETTKPMDAETSIREALRMISESKSRYRNVSDYSCDFYKRERINGKLTELHVMTMKERTQPKSIYFKFKQPNRGREAIYVEGKNNGSILAHDVGLTKFLAGTMELDPKGWRAMENNRHPITEAGIGELIDTVESRWAKELHPKHSIINHFQEIQVGPHNSVVMIESIHPDRDPEFLFHKVRLFINREHGLPIRFEAYDWPKTPESEPELVEEYTYLNLKLNQGLKDTDFDPANSEYSFGRF